MSKYKKRSFKERSTYEPPKVRFAELISRWRTSLTQPKLDQAIIEGLGKYDYTPKKEVKRNAK